MQLTIPPQSLFSYLNVPLFMLICYAFRPRPFMDKITDLLKKKKKTCFSLSRIIHVTCQNLPSLHPVEISYLNLMIFFFLPNKKPPNMS